MKRLLPVLCLSLLITGAALAQPGGGTCPTTVNDALQRLNAECGALTRNEACYASNLVTATFYEEVDETIFSEPSDIVPLNTLQRISTSPLSETGDSWGVAIMNVQANIPNTLPGQGVIMVMMGDTTMENAVSPEQAVVLSDPVEAVVIADGAVNVRSGAGSNFNVLGTVTPGAVLGVDARNEAGDWLRLVFEDQPAWIASFLVDYPEDINALPVIGSTSFSPMQAFILQTGIGRPECQNAPNSLLVQSPQSVEITLNVNGLDVAVASTVLFTGEQEKLSIGVLDGRATLPGNRVVPEGFKAEAPLNEDGLFDDTFENDDEDPFIVEPFEDEELDDLDAFDDIEGDFLNYDVEVADELEDFETFEDIDIDAFLEEFDGDFDFEDFEAFGFDVDDYGYGYYDDDSYGYYDDDDSYGYYDDDDSYGYYDDDSYGYYDDDGYGYYDDDSYGYYDDDDSYGYYDDDDSYGYYDDDSYDDDSYGYDDDDSYGYYDDDSYDDGGYDDGGYDDGGYDDDGGSYDDGGDDDYGY